MGQFNHQRGRFFPLGFGKDHREAGRQSRWAACSSLITFCMCRTCLKTSSFDGSARWAQCMILYTLPFPCLSISHRIFSSSLFLGFLMQMRKTRQYNTTGGTVPAVKSCMGYQASLVRVDLQWCVCWRGDRRCDEAGEYWCRSCQTWTVDVSLSFRYPLVRWLWSGHF